MNSGRIARKLGVGARHLSSSQTVSNKSKHFKLLIIGGGSGGCSVAAKFSRKLDPSTIAVVEPSDTHYYQPMWTMVGGGMKSLLESGRPMSSVLPKGVVWIQEKATEFDVERSTVKVSGYTEHIGYDFLVVASGIQLKYAEIKGLPEAFSGSSSGLCSNYSPLYVNKTWESLQNLKSGNAIFTFPNTPIKCAGAPQKILYIADAYLRSKGRRDGVELLFNSSLGALFGVQKYAEVLWGIVEKRGIKVNLKRNLIEVALGRKERKAIFQDLENPGKTEIYDFEMLHVTPPMGPQEVMKNAGELVDPQGYVNLDKGTLQHVKYHNIFGLGDCTNLPTSKTAAAVAAQCGVLYNNLWRVMNGKDASSKYDGYTSCPLVTSYSTCVLAEFDYAAQPLETFPFDQGKERWSSFLLKKEVMPQIYWRLMLNGYWDGPRIIRKISHLGMSK